MIDDLPWLKAPWRRAAAAMQSGRFPQGLLILGNRGLGRTRLARLIAAARLCPQPLEDGRACGACASCRQVAAGAHPDLVEVGVLEDKTVIVVDQIRELSRALSLASGSRGLRCAIIRSAEKMNIAASNALLKTLEEAPNGVSIIMVTERLAALPVTIASRSLQLQVTAPDEAAALEWLGRQEAREDWPLLLALSAGAPLAAMRLAEEWSGSPADDIRLLGEAAAGRADPIAVAGKLKNVPLERLGSLVAWLAQGALHAQFTDPASIVLRDFGVRAGQADQRALYRVWHSARTLAVDNVSLNAELARERLILLFVDALHRPLVRSS